MTELNEWLGRALAQDYDLVWLPLDNELREHLSVDSLINWFNSVEHSKHNSVLSFFAAFDTPD